MANVLVVVSSVRPGRVAEKLLPYVVDDVKARDGVEVTVADLKEIDLPFFDSAVIPADPSFAPTDERVKRWTKLVADADSVVFLTPEYNHAINAVQKNAIDWIKDEWEGKPVSFVGYGWGGASFAIEDAKRSFDWLKAKFQPGFTQLFFTKQLAPDGSVLDEEAVRSSIKATLDEVLAA